MENNIDIELLYKKCDKFNARARYNYHQRTLKGTNIKIIKKEERKKRGRKPLLTKEPVNKNPVGRPPNKEITEEALLKKQYGHLMLKGPRGRGPKQVEHLEVFIDTFENC
jgi:hypothetical protein